MRTFNLPAGRVGSDVQDAWDEYHKTPTDFTRVKPYFVKIAVNSLEGKINYAKFLLTHDQREAEMVLLDLREQSASAMFYLAHNVLWRSGRQKLSVHFYRLASNKGHYVASIWYPLRVISILNFKNRVKFFPKCVVKFFSALLDTLRNASVAISQL